MNRLKKDASLNLPPISGIEVGCRKHFTKEEWVLIRRTHWCKIKKYITLLLDEFESNCFLKNNYGTEVMIYVYILAFWQRIRLPLEWALKAKFSIKTLHCLIDAPNFKELLRSIDHNFISIAILHGHRLKADNEAYRAKVREKVLYAALKLWLAGYGIRPGLGIETINKDILESAVLLNKDRSTRCSFRLLSEALRLTPESPIKTTLPGGFYQENKSTVFVKEQEAWDKEVLLRSNSEFIKLIHQYTFTNLLSRVNQMTIVEHVNQKGTLVAREGSKPITWISWKAYSFMLRKFACQCIACESETIEKAFDIGKESPLTRVMIDPASKNLRGIIRVYAEWLVQSSNATLDLKNLFPRKQRREDRIFGRVFSMGMAHTLIGTLLDDSSPLFDETNIHDFRCRRAALLCLALASRPHEILCLTRNCLKQDHFGFYHVMFHKTKPRRSCPSLNELFYVHVIHAKDDVIKWIRELQKCAPKNKMILKSEAGFGDDADEYRLFANFDDRGPLAVSTLNSWLARLQKKIWPSRKKAYFTSRDFRALSLTYEVITGKKLDYRMHKAGRKDKNSERPYVATLPSIEVKKFGDILERGIWSKSLLPKENYNEYKETIATDSSIELGEDRIPIASIIQVTNSFKLTSDKLNQVKLLVEKTMQKVSDKDLQNKPFYGLKPVGYNHNCTAPIHLKCSHSPDRCRSCQWYNPDEGSEKEHQAQIFSSMVYYFQCIKEGKKIISSGQRHHVHQKASDLKQLIEGSVNGTWIRGFNMNENDAKRLHMTLWRMAKNYYMTYLSKPSSLEQVFSYLELRKAEFDG